MSKKIFKKSVKNSAELSVIEMMALAEKLKIKHVESWKNGEYDVYIMNIDQFRFEKEFKKLNDANNKRLKEIL